MRIVLIGHPGSGKSTLAKILLKEFIILSDFLYKIKNFHN